jgi:MFS transporter, ACS family, glucarate transporter
MKNSRVWMSSSGKTSFRWFVAAMVAGFAFVSYVERMNISVAAAMMMPDMSLTKTQMGQVFSSFLWGYAIFQVPAGRMGDVFGPRLTLTVAAILWGVTSVLTGLLPGLIFTGTYAVIGSLLILRFLLGAAEAATFPVGARAIRNWTPLRERGLGNSIMIAGASIAAAVTSPLVSWLMLQVGWRNSFYITSLAAFALALIWYLTVMDDPKDHSRVGAEELKILGNYASSSTTHGSRRTVPILNLLRNRKILLLSLSYTCEGYVLFIFVFWLYLYLIEVRGFTMLNGGLIASLPWLTAFACTPIGGWFCDRISESKGRVAGARTVIMIGYGLSGTLLFAAAKSDSRTLCVAALCLSVGFLYFAEPAFWATSLHIAGENAGASSGIMNTAGILGGIVSTSLVPIIVKHFGWMPALASGAVVAVACTGAWFVMGRIGFSDAAPVSHDEFGDQRA